MNLLSFKLREKSSERLVLTFNYGFRIFFFLIAAFLLYFSMTDIDNTKFNPGPVLVMFTFLIAGSYMESWDFNKAMKAIIQKHGLLFLAKKQTIPIKLAKAIILSGFYTGTEKSKIKGRSAFFQKKYLKLCLSGNDGKMHVIEIQSVFQKEKLQEKAKKIAQFLQIPYAEKNIQ